MSICKLVDVLPKSEQRLTEKKNYLRTKFHNWNKNHPFPNPLFERFVSSFNRGFTFSNGLPNDDKIC